MKSCQNLAVVCDHRVAQCELDESGQIVGIDFLPTASTQLAEIEATGCVVHLVVPAGHKQDESRLEQFVPASWLVHQIGDGRDCESRTNLWRSLGDSTLVVASDRALRDDAQAAGLNISPCLASAQMVLTTPELCFVCLEGDLRDFVDRNIFLPWFYERRPTGGALSFGLLTPAGLAKAVARGVGVTRLPFDYLRHDALLIHLDENDDAAASALGKLRILWAERQRVLVAIDADTDTDDIGVHGAHGHFFALAPNPALLRPVNGHECFLAADELALARLPYERLPYERVPVLDPDILVRPPACPTSAAGFQTIVDRYAGVSDLDSSGTIVSRHSRHPDNQRAIDALVDDLNDMGYCAFRHYFTHNGETLQNVIADLPGRGRFTLNPAILEKLRQLLAQKNVRLINDRSLLDPLAEILGKDWVQEQRLDELHPLLAVQKLERALFLHPWYPWRYKLCPLYSPGADLLLVGCHMDSTAGLSSGYDPVSDAAPGADDDASGIAATLSMARWFRNHYAGKLTHTLRFCFFNAEESGLIGSKAYAAHLKSCNAPVRAVFCSDMIGYNSDVNRIFEIHAGYTNAAVRDASVPYATAIETWAASLGQLAPAQIYSGTSSVGGPDRDAYDGAINRSDHAAFHEQGYPAVLVSEDFFANLASEPGNDPNPNYHSQQDTLIDADYAADIVCATAQAIRAIAQ